MTESIEGRSPSPETPEAVATGDTRHRAPLPEEALALLEARAERLRRHSAVQEEETRWVALFPVGEDQYALPLQALRGAMPLRLVTPVPLAPPGIVGVVRHQGRILTVLSLASLLGCRGWRQDPAVLLVLERGDGELVACDCEQVPVATAIPALSLAQAPASADGLTRELRLPGNGIAQLIDVGRLLERLGGEAS